MTERSARRSLFAGLLVLAPLPMLFLDHAFVPVARYALLFGVCASVALVEDAGGVVLQVGAVFLAHALVYAALLWCVAFAAARALRRLRPRSRGALVALALAAATLAALTTTPYRTPFGRSARGSLWQVLQ